MQQLIDEVVEHLSMSHQQLARILEAERHIAVRMAQIVHAVPDQHPDLGGFDGLLEGAQAVGKNLVAYLNGIAELQETLAEHLTVIVKELGGGESEE
jgi:hypothetical protein